MQNNSAHDEYNEQLEHCIRAKDHDKVLRLLASPPLVGLICWYIALGGGGSLTLEDIQDGLQELLRKLYAALRRATFDPNNPLRYFLAAARNQGIDLGNAKRRRPHHSGPETLVNVSDPHPASAPDCSVIQEDQLHRVCESLRALAHTMKPRQKQVLLAILDLILDPNQKVIGPDGQVNHDHLADFIRRKTGEDVTPNAIRKALEQIRLKAGPFLDKRGYHEFLSRPETEGGEH